MANRFSVLKDKSLRADYLAQFKQSIVEVMVMLACAIILIVLVGIFAFIGVQGGRYFLPMSTYQVTTYFQPDVDVGNAELLNNAGLLTSLAQPLDSPALLEAKADNSAAPAEVEDYNQIEYMLSHLSGDDLVNSLQQKLAIQYIARNQTMPTVVVTAADNLYLVNTISGQKFVGEFVSLQEGAKLSESLGQLDGMQSKIERLQQNFNDIQVDRLQALHKEINELNNKKVDPATPLYQRKLAEFVRWQEYANKIIKQINSHKVNLRLDNNKIISIAVSNVQDIYQPNQLSWWQSLGYIVNQVYIFVTDSPKQASTSGGVFPAIFGTLLMVIIMAVIVTPFGAISAIYLHEYAPDNRLTTTIRICVSNMAAVPSVVYGVFGLGFFVYALGGSIDSLLYSDKLPSPTFGAPGLLWASLTMGILTLPVVIVATEEGLSRVPGNLRTGALALGATKYETIVKVVLPMASPGILTGVILAIARAAGEVAPLILVGAVKFAPTLPIDGEFPFVHLERQFMHLGVFVYDGAFHNQTETQVSSLMFATCMLLLLVVLSLNLSAILIRNKLRHKYERLL
ncbi:MAG: phosphate transport system permease protein [Alphaproteobacteria bacterium]|jgi:phosphate transport system permease protein